MSLLATFLRMFPGRACSFPVVLSDEKEKEELDRKLQLWLAKQQDVWHGRDHPIP